MWGKNVPSRGNSTKLYSGCLLEYLRNSKEGPMAGVEKTRGDILEKWNEGEVMSESWSRDIWYRS